MPQAAILQSINEWKAALLRGEQATLQTMTTKWVDVTQNLELRAQLLADDIAARLQAGEVISQSKLFQMERYQSYIAQARQEQANYSNWAAGLVTEQQQAAAGVATIQAVQTLSELQSAGGQVIGSFTRLPVQAIERMIGQGADGSPLANLLQGSWPETNQQILSYLTSGLAEGLNPRDIARGLASSLDVSLDRAMLLARTEPLRAYRESSLATYERSGVVEGYQRLSARDARVCAACLFADNGEIWPLSIPFEEHVCGRCTPMPVVEGLPPIERQNGQEWFLEQDASTQEDILGPSRYEIWKEQDLDLNKFISRHEDDTWGNSLHVTSLEDLLSDDPPPAFSVPDPEPPPDDGSDGGTPRVILDKESDIRGIKTHEEALVTDGYGNVLLEKSGGKSSVDFTEADVANFRLAGNAILTHNHPRSSSFSSEDLQFSAWANLAEIRAVGENITHILLRPDSGWPSWKILEKAYKRESEEVFQRFSKEIKLGNLTIEEANAEHAHQIMLALSKKYKLDYTRK